MDQADHPASKDRASAADPERRPFRVRSPDRRLEFDFRLRTLHDASTIIFGATVLLTLANLLIGGTRTWSVAVVYGLCLAGGIAGRVAHLRRRPELGWWALSGFLVAAITWNVAFHGGIDAPAIVQYVVLIAVVARMLRARAAAIAATVCLAALGAAAWAQTAGLLPDSRLLDMPWRHALTAAITVALLAVLMWYASRQDSMQHHARERIEDFARASDGWFWETDADGKLYWVSEGAAPALHVAPAWLVGKTLPELDDRNTDAPFSTSARVFHETLKRGEPVRGLRILRREADGQERWFEISGLPRVAADGQLLGYRGVALTVSDRGMSSSSDPAEINDNLPLAEA